MAPMFMICSVFQQQWMNAMSDPVSATEFRRNLSKYLDDICDGRAVLQVTRHNQQAVVMIAADEFQAMIDTLDLLGDPATYARAVAAMDRAGPQPANL
jgi:PHD/YefM family antitoxin component YafN of YafNO toxin-antitoxin module